MMKRLCFAVSAAALLLSSCAQEGGGPLGFVAFDRNHHVAAAEPLFGRDEDRCIDSPSFLLSIFSESEAAPMGVPARLEPTCQRLRESIIAVLRAQFPSATPAGATLAAGTPAWDRGEAAQYDERARNEIVDALVASSNRRCGRYMAFLQTYDSNINVSFGLLSIIAGGLAPIVRGDDTARTLGGLSSMFSGTRSTFNEAHFRNQTIAVLVAAFEAARIRQRREMTNLQQCPVSQYTLMRGLEDSFRYHNSCSVVFGVDEAARAVQRANAPDFAMMRQMAQQISAWRTALQPTPPATTTETGTTTPTPQNGATETTPQNGGQPETQNGAAPGATVPAVTGGNGNPTTPGGAHGETPPSCPFGNQTRAPALNGGQSGG